MKSRKKNKYLILLIVLLAIGIGFAALSTTLKLNGTTNVSANTWSVYWDEDSIVVNPNSKSLTSPTVSDDIEDENTILNWTVDLDLPGDFYEFSIDAVNAGTLDAMITNITEGIPDDLPNYISYSVTYADGFTPAQYHKLPKAKGNIPTRQKYKVRVEYLNTITLDQLNEIGEDGLSYSFTYEVQYSQASDRAITKPTFFGTATWDQIIAEYNGGDLHHVLEDDMKQEALRDIELDLDHNGTPETTGHLRIANLSTPIECSGENYSQTACGFVIEFADVVTTHMMNYYDKNGYATGIGQGTWGGWEYSDIRAYLNGGVYSYNSTDYSTNSFLLAMPIDIRSRIIDTKVSSSSNHGGNTDTSIVIDKLYYLAPREVWGSEVSHSDLQYDIIFNNTRQLDYYHFVGAAPDDDNYAKLIKEIVNHDQQSWEGIPANWSKDFWGLRAAYANPSYDSSFYRVMKNGSIGWTYSVNSHGVSPAFRIAKVN